MSKKINVVDMSGKGGIVVKKAVEGESGKKEKTPKTKSIIHHWSQVINDVLTLQDVNDAYKIQWVAHKDISTNESAFQNRKAKYSMNSVNGIIDAVIDGSFIWHMCDPVRVWQDPKDNNLYVIAGHSRLEAFRRLSQEPLASIPSVKEFLKKCKMKDFSQVPVIVLPKTLSFEDAKFVAIMSNTLSSYESDTERAYYYYELRKLWKLTKSEFDERLKKYEKGNAKVIEALSFLNPHGKAIQELDSFENNTDNDQSLASLKKCSYRTGIARKNLPELTNVHEREIFEWLYEKGIYGKSSEQISTFEKYWAVLTQLLEEAKANNKFHPNKLINLAESRSLSPYMKEWYEQKKFLRNARRKLNETTNSDVTRYQKQILKWQWTTLFEMEVEQRTIVQSEIAHQIAYTEEQWKKLMDAVKNDKDMQKVRQWIKVQKADITVRLKLLEDNKPSVLQHIATVKEFEFPD